jgi:hypothetical protein
MMSAPFDAAYQAAWEQWDRERRAECEGVSPLDVVAARKIAQRWTDPWNDPEVHDPYSSAAEAGAEI